MSQLGKQDGLADGWYQIEPRISRPWGGVNSSDALLVLQHYSGAAALTGLPLLASDVNGSQTVNASDALLIARRFSGMVSSCPVADWLTDLTGPSQARPYGSAPIPISTICAGDVNASYIP